MPAQPETIHRLAGIPHLTILEGVPLSRYTRFGIGGPAAIYVETPDESSFIQALGEARASGLNWTVIGGGTNLVASDAGFPGIVLRFTGAEIRSDGECVRAAAGAELQALVDYCVERGLKGIETMTGIPGSVGGAVYGNAGAYGHSIDERAREVRFHDGERIRAFGNAECGFRYRESVFKRHKDWIVFSVALRMDRAPAGELHETADGILKVRNQKYPPTMKCAGSIFKNLILAELPESARSVVPREVIREGKVPSAWFLEQVGAKGLRRGDIRVADYHANLIYNDGHGVARDLCEVIAELKARVRERFGLELEEEVQFI
jgi:UDP-N-acetylmuramate dehydrogenase